MSLDVKISLSKHDILLTSYHNFQNVITTKITVYWSHWLCFVTKQKGSCLKSWKGWIDKQQCLCQFYWAWLDSFFCQVSEMLLFYKRNSRLSQDNNQDWFLSKYQTRVQHLWSARVIAEKSFRPIYYMNQQITHLTCGNAKWRFANKPKDWDRMHCFLSTFQLNFVGYAMIKIQSK